MTDLDHMCEYFIWWPDKDKCPNWAPSGRWMFDDNDDDDDDQAIQELTELRSKTDASLGGLAADDLITAPSAQQQATPLIDNLINVLEKQK